jgi:hypothetical protein
VERSALSPASLVEAGDRVSIVGEGEWTTDDADGETPSVAPDYRAYIPVRQLVITDATVSDHSSWLG